MTNKAYVENRMTFYEIEKGNLPELYIKDFILKINPEGKKLSFNSTFNENVCTFYLDKYGNVGRKVERKGKVLKDNIFCELCYGEKEGSLERLYHELVNGNVKEQ